MPKALIVEDELEANELLAMLVQLRGYETISASTGKEALEKAAQSKPDLILLDLMLPDINGYEVCRHLKSHRETSSIPVVMVTARLADENRIQGFRVGTTAYVPKPYTPDQLYRAIAEADTWRSRLVEAPETGTIPIDSRAEISHLREISRLWATLLERTPLTEDEALAIDQILVEVASRAVAWGARSDEGLVASVDYRCNHEGLTLTIHDNSGWFVADSPRRTEGLGGLLVRGPFDEVVHNQRHPQITLSRLFSH